ncbi:MAG: KamA family radical SAM protein [Methylacidiphilales bacterium]|nr:KamA family radical SAM protein [Candidatus Methylacidiphilales bacterium]
MSRIRFNSSYPGFWGSVSPTDWNDWGWQLRHRINSLEELERYMGLTPEERAGIILTGSKLAMSITPHFFNLIDVNDPDCPIRRQVIPRLEESTYLREEMADPCGEDSMMPVPGLVHRYPDRVLFLVTDRCASYCRYCTRSRVVSGVGEQELETDFEEAFRYLEKHEEIRDVLFSGGDPLLLSDAKLESLLSRVRRIPHIEFVRIGSRVPIFLPQRITPELCAMLKKYHPLWISIHSNHPKELTSEVRDALGRLSDAGIPLGNQAVLLRGVNDDADVLKELLHKLLMCRVRPYYLYQCDLIRGSAHLRTTIQEGLEIMDKLRGFTTGYAIPQYVVDGPGGGGKIPLNPDYIVARTGERILLRNYKGDIYEYPEAGPEIEIGAARNHHTSEFGPGKD